MLTPGLAVSATAFGLELVALTAFGLWGVSLGPILVSRVALGVGAPLLVAVFWGMFLSPKAAIPLAPPYRLSLKLAIFALATAALFVNRHPVAGVFFSSLVVLNVLWLHLLETYRKPPL